jgi:hypothetical protein
VGASVDRAAGDGEGVLVAVGDWRIGASWLTTLIVVAVVASTALREL